MAISVKLEAFEGPLDLLLHLIEKNKIDIYDIPIVEITAQYLDYIRQMQREDMNVMSEFLVMAAVLIEQQANVLLDWDLASSLATVLLVVTGAMYVVYMQLTGNATGNLKGAL